MEENKTKIVIRVFGPKPLEPGISFEHTNTELDDVLPIIKGDEIFYLCKYKSTIKTPESI